MVELADFLHTLRANGKDELTFGVINQSELTKIITGEFSGHWNTMKYNQFPIRLPSIALPLHSINWPAIDCDKHAKYPSIASISSIHCKCNWLIVLIMGNSIPMLMKLYIGSAIPWPVVSFIGLSQILPTESKKPIHVGKYKTPTSTGRWLYSLFNYKDFFLPKNWKVLTKKNKLLTNFDLRNQIFTLKPKNWQIFYLKTEIFDLINQKTKFRP